MNDPFEPGFLRRMPEEPRRVVIVRASRIGDFLCATPAFRALRRALPEAEITFVGLPWAADLVARSDALDRFERFPGYPGIAEQWFDARRLAAFAARAQRRRYDLAVQLHGSGVYANPFTLLLGARRTVGFVRAGDGPGRLDAAFPYPDEGHEVDRALALAAFLGAPADDRRTRFPLWPADKAAAAALVSRAATPLIALHATATDAARQWATDRFVEAGRRLRAETGGTLVLVGGPGERPVASAIARAVGEPVLNLAGRTTLPVLGALIERCALLVSTDSGPAHIAYAVGAPTVTLFGPTDPIRWGPPHDARHHVLLPDTGSPCDHDRCSCIDRIEVDDVVEHGMRVLARDAAAAS